MLDIQEIKKLIPHRYPFLMVDRVLRMTEKKPGQIVGRVLQVQKNVTGNEPFFTGHFPGHPVMPGVLILEAIAQTGALCCSAIQEKSPHIEQVFLVGMDKARFRKPVYPGDVLNLKVEMKKNKGAFFWGEGQAFVEKNLVASVNILAHITFQTKKTTKTNSTYKQSRA